MADNEDQSSKTEEPTERKLRKLREEGQVPRSREVNNLLMLVAMLLVVGLVLPDVMRKLMIIYAQSLQSSGIVSFGSGYTAWGGYLTTLIWKSIGALMPALLVMVVFALIGGVIQTGLIFSGKSIQPKISKIAIDKGFKRIFSMRSVMEFFKSVVKLLIIGSAMAAVLIFYKRYYVGSPDLSVMNGITVMWQVMIWMLVAALFIMVVLAMVDYIFEYNKFRQEQKMSRQELKDEFKESEGDPFVKQRQRQLRQERAQQRMMSNIPNADVVITNPTHYSVALQYGDDNAAPVVVAKGVDFIAMRIREIAEEHDIPFYEDPPLARQLYADVEVDEEIPLALYQAVAKVIAFIYNLKKKQAK